MVKVLLCRDTCLLCSRSLHSEEEVLCPACFERCQQKSLLHCLAGYYFVYWYQSEIREMLHEYKFQGRRSLGKIIAKCIKLPFWECYEREEIEIVIPVPIHEERLLQRGFNQTEEILKYLQVPYDILTREKNTEALFQHHEKSMRETILKEAFVCSASLAQKMTGKNILLFDDIITTGTTMEEMKKAIYKCAKPNKISVFSVSLSERVKIEQKNIQN